MPTTLVIVESPAKCKKIEQFLGPGYKVIASFGHLRTIDGLNAIDTKNKFLTNYSIIQEPLKLKQIEKIRNEISNSDDVIIATDDDREGESIGWHICDLFGLSVEHTKRIIFHEITESAIQSAVAYPKRINMDLVHAQQARQILDLLVGFTISPILWKYISKNHDGSLSAGRCQTPALRLVYDNYLDIKQSPGKVVYKVVGYFTNKLLPFELSDELTKEEEVLEFLNECKTYEFICNVGEPKRKIQLRPEPLTTSSLQQLASNDLNMSPKDTMKCAQQLYENGFITYMRTDSKQYSTEFIDSAKEYIVKTYGEQYANQSMIGMDDGMNHVIDNRKNKSSFVKKHDIPPPQEAHEAIRPVNINVSKIDETQYDMLKKAFKLYELIWKHALKSCMSSSQYQTITAKIKAPFEKEFLYTTEEPIFLGWKIVDSTNKSNNKETFKYIQHLTENLLVKYNKIDVTFALTGLKSHYTEARLVKLLEEKGIGRPSTFASLVDKIQERKYVEKQNVSGQEIECKHFSLENGIVNELTIKKQFGNENNKLVIQPLGIIIIEFLIEKFPTFFDYDYTKEMETSLDKVASNELEWTSICENCCNELTNETKDFKKFSIEIDEKHSLIIGKHGPVVKCVEDKNVSFIPVKKDLNISNLKENVLLEDVIDISKTSIDNKPIGKYKGKDLFVKNGKFGIYAQWGNERTSLKEMIGNKPLEEIQYIDVLRFLERDKTLDASKPVGLVRELTKNISIRSGKYGDYIYYKKPRAKKPDFFKLNEFNGDYKNCNKDVLMNWIKQKYNIE